MSWLEPNDMELVVVLSLLFNFSLERVIKGRWKEISSGEIGVSCLSRGEAARS